MKNDINRMNNVELQAFIKKRVKDIEIMVDEYATTIDNKIQEGTSLQDMKKRAYHIRRIYNYALWVNEQIKINDNPQKSSRIVPRRGEIWTCELGQNVGSEENKVRPVIIIQNNTGNKKSPTTIVAPISNRPKKIAVHIELREDDYKLENGEKNYVTGTILAEQIKVVSKARLGRHIATVNKEFMKILDSKLKISLEL
ncbi:type II toxin-antitoxin system PemK/MazF family toxin [Clostridium sp. MB40-C1]|uniref:type II toxin-antitoxin system PemK/MazF family toxin n=1 Tax=Clostridium sp. MB40-C1 TaxID=3070996 RepID=UPI0027E1832C|nr:type II toxin-antitoxin system PemK/MazF family toxin [Clostridium sp. MB40-C1]WMJ79821.1 type II toxin-antitoxin system PemK/MazF family toxin [Clostridium sp. MB40-C1]